ncbi:MAG: serine/threonine-protein kinase [Gemmatimonadota bacterium]
MSHIPDENFIALQAALAGEYSLDRELGRGGMGIVYLAREVRLARHVAIKVLPPALAERRDVREAFLRESRTVAGLNHPNIVPVHAAGERGGFVYIVMAYVEGTTLGERIRTRGPLLPGQAARVLREVAWALAYAHAAGIVHRDVSAENILLERGSDRAIVMDFGIASAMWSAAVDDEGRVMGNAHYVSPEQAVGEPVDARSDLYSLGVCGFYALTGRLPFDGKTPADVVHQHLVRTPPAISTIARAVPPRLGQAVDRCLAKEPLRRYRTAESFAEAIDLAFEHAKDIPAALRVWIGRGEQEMPPRLVMIGLSAFAGLALVAATSNPFSFLVPVGITTVVTLLPALTRLRRVLADGYIVEDLQTALREHALSKSEEIAYERSQVSPGAEKAVKFAFGTSVVSGMYCAQQVAHIAGGWPTRWESPYFAGMLVSLGMLGLTSAMLIGGIVRLKWAAKMSSAAPAFWGSKWGARIARVAGFGLRTADRPAFGKPLLTEVALGRATDHLFQSLSKASRKELAALPETVRGLEREASKLRASIEGFDNQIAMFEQGDTRRANELSTDIERELRAAREATASKLGATVAALENIRLELLRLQLGSAGIESVTATLEAAQRIGELIVQSVEANEEVERMLRGGQTPDRRALDAPYEDVAEDDDADTPVGGVPATSG